MACALHVCTQVLLDRLEAQPDVAVVAGAYTQYNSSKHAAEVNDYSLTFSRLLPPSRCRWDAQIVTLPLGGGAAAASSQLLLRVVLCEQREDGRGGAVPVGVAEATVDPRYPAVVGPLELKGATLRHALIAFSMRGERQADAA